LHWGCGPSSCGAGIAALCLIGVWSRLAVHGVRLKLELGSLDDPQERELDPVAERLARDRGPVTLPLRPAAQVHMPASRKTRSCGTAPSPLPSSERGARWRPRSGRHWIGRVSRWTHRWLRPTARNLNIDIERADPKVENLNLRNQITGETHRAQVETEIKADPAVKAKGYCP
jgi:hypothetical protein